MSEQSDPTQDEIERVAAYWQKVEALVCKHPEIKLTHDSMTCASCGRPVRIMSDVQIKDLKERASQDG